jgi:hypothetical protein
VVRLLDRAHLGRQLRQVQIAEAEVALRASAADQVGGVARVAGRVVDRQRQRVAPV